MLLKGKKIGFGFTGAYCVFDQVFPQLEFLVKEGAVVVPVVSYQVTFTDSRYGKASDFLQKMKAITGNDVIQTIPDAEVFNKKETPLDLFIICPFTGCSLSKLADGANDTPVLMMAKELLRNNKPVVLGIATNDGLGLSARSIATLLITKNIFFVPFGQDNPTGKPNSLISDFELTLPTILEAFNKEQLQPILVQL